MFSTNYKIKFARAFICMVQGLDIDPVSGAEMQQLLSRLYAPPPDVIDLVCKINGAN